MAVVCKRSTVLPPLAGVERWDEPDEPRHPVTGLAHALDRAGRSVLVCAADMPFVSSTACRTVLDAAVGAGLLTKARPSAGAGSPPAIVAESGHGLEPVLGVYGPAALPLLRAAPEGRPLRATVEALGPVRVSLPARVVRNVNTPAELAAAEAELAAAP